ncbi:hypothetical protein C8Q72DRAFT_467804 [Fomitopsis betulina]|nr:hypothetical protein C8Q72DRAFT_467804 [Fomitopsis betulina]
MPPRPFVIQIAILSRTSASHVVRPPSAIHSVTSATPARRHPQSFYPQAWPSRSLRVRPVYSACRHRADGTYE